MRQLEHNALQSLRHRRGEMSPVAIVFIVLGVLFLLGILFVGIIVFGAMLPAMQRAQTAAIQAQSKNNLKQIGLALHNYHDVYNGFPLGDALPAANPVPHHSWMARILPFVEQAGVYNQIDFHQPWNSTANRTAAMSTVPTFINSSYADQITVAEGYAVSHYAGSTHIFRDNEMVGIRDVTDGTSNTIMAGEVSTGFTAWADPANRRDPALGLGNTSTQFGAAPGAATCQILLMDGSVRQVSTEISPEIMAKLATPAGGETIDGF